MKLDLFSFFKLIENDTYVIIKPSSILPDYDPGSDIDIFCYHPMIMIEKISSFISKYLNSESSISIFEDATKAHVDYIVNNKINFRFDIYKTMPVYNNIILKPSFFSSAIESSVHRIFNRDKSFVTIKVPSVIDEFILRYVEYHEYYSEMPDKIKHIEYIENFIPGEMFNVALDKLHYYTSFPKIEYCSKSIKDLFGERINYTKFMIKKINQTYRRFGFKFLLFKIISHLRKKK